MNWWAGLLTILFGAYCLWGKLGYLRESQLTGPRFVLTVIILLLAAGLAVIAAII